MTDKQREAFELRAIVVSTRAALLKGANSTQVRDRSDKLMAVLESKVIRDGADAEVLANIEAARRALWQGAE